MEKEGILLVFCCWIVCGTVEVMAAEDDCDFSDVNAEQMVTNVLSNLPASYTEPDLKPEKLFLGISVGPPSIKNTDIFELYGPVSTYCRKGAKLVQVDIVADRPMEFSAPWKICTGREGTVGLYGTARVTVTFEVVNGTVEGEPHAAKKLVLHGYPMPVAAVVNSVYLQGAEEPLLTAVAASRLILPRLSQEIWEGEMKFSLHKMLVKATEHS